MRFTPTALSAVVIGAAAMTTSSTSSLSLASAFVVTPTTLKRSALASHDTANSPTAYCVPTLSSSLSLSSSPRRRQSVWSSGSRSNAVLQMSAPAREGPSTTATSSTSASIPGGGSPFFFASPAVTTVPPPSAAAAAASTAASIPNQHYKSKNQVEGPSSHSSSTSSSSKSVITKEVSSGTSLGDGSVIDFASVRDGTSKAERALSAAKAQYLKSLHHAKPTSIATTFSPSQLQPQSSSRSNKLMGINDEVISEVGHDIGTFATFQEIQDCACYLRSLAPPGLLKSSSASSSSFQEFTREEKSEYQSLLSKSYEESGLVTEAFAKTFYLGTQLLPLEAQRSIWAVYVWCRRTDEIVDAPRLGSATPQDDMLMDLSAWEIRLERLWQYGEVVDVLDLPLLHVRVTYPTLAIEPFRDMIRGMLMDIPELGQERYDTFDELHLYCYRVAGTVGLMSLPIFGCARGIEEEDAKEPALSLGVAFQMTNILRDVGEDAAKRGRVYLPQQDMKKFDVTEEQIFAKRVDENYVQLMKYEIDRARMYYDRAMQGVSMLAPESRLPVQISLDAYAKILDKIEANGYDSLNYRAYVSKWEKLLTIPFSWYRTLEISRAFPLPGDRPLGVRDTR